MCQWNAVGGNWKAGEAMGSVATREVRRTAEERKSCCSLVRGLRLGVSFAPSAADVLGWVVETKRIDAGLALRAERTAWDRMNTRGDAIVSRKSKPAGLH